MFFTHPLPPLERGDYILYHQVKERREKRNSRNHLFRDYGSKGREREAHPEFLVVWVVQTCRGVVKTFFEVVFSSDINTTFTTRSFHRKGVFSVFAEVGSATLVFTNRFTFHGFQGFVYSM